MPKIVDKDKMRAEILEAAMMCFARTGYQATKMTDIARAAGVAKGTLYLYCDGKDDLILSLIGQYFDGLRGQITLLPAPQTLELYLDGLRQTVILAQRDMTSLIFEVLGPGFKDPRAVEIIDGFFDWLARHWAEHFADLAEAQEIRADCDPMALARAVIAMLDGVFLHLSLFDAGAKIATLRRETAFTMIASGLRG